MAGKACACTSSARRQARIWGKRKETFGGDPRTITCSSRMMSVTRLSPNAAGRGVDASAPAYLDRVAHQNKLTMSLVSCLPCSAMLCPQLGELVAIIIGARHLTEPISSSRPSACWAQPRPSFSSPRDGIRIKSHASPQSRARSQTTSGSSRLWTCRMTPHSPSISIPLFVPLQLPFVPQVPRSPATAVAPSLSYLHSLCVYLPNTKPASASQRVICLVPSRCFHS